MDSAATSAGATSESAAGIDLGRLDAWVPAMVPGLDAPVSGRLLSGGRSNLTYTLQDASGRTVVLRRPPLGSGAAHHDILREAAILRAVEAAPIPTPRVLATCDDDSVIGAPFFVMTYEPGAVLSTPDDARTIDPGTRAVVGSRLAETLAALHGVPLEALGLTAPARSHLERQLRTWGRQIDALAPDRRRPLEVLREALAARRPAQQRTCLTHGDFKLANLAFDADGKVVAVFDWELSTVGDPMIDLGWFVAAWAPPDEADAWIVPPATCAPGFATRDEVAERYATASGIDVGDLDYYVAFACWRWTCINEGIRRRFSSGVMAGNTVDLDRLDRQVSSQLATAGRLLGVDLAHEVAS